ncbi:MAG: AAA family ATPase [Polyangiaceae bacterium]
MNGLFYSQRDIRSFVAGLATSRLHLLQGISGTGKTSLPIAFARAVGADSALIPVQAGWRDRADLIGHFNSFEKRFHETEFLQALYRVRCPSHAGRPHFIVLDEMNLSHPEQYFADLLSALEANGEQAISLMPAAAANPPAGLREGRTLLLPENVWFVGTANHDETTKDFADKTYDRAHVMELPRHRESFQASPAPVRPPIAHRALCDAFREAERQFRAEAQKAYSFLDSSLSEVLAERFGVGWGNRLERQVSSFVPVVIAAGGDIGEAVDHLLATKILRKIRDRHDTRPEDILALKKRLDSDWGDLTRKSDPSRSVEILRGELRRLGGASDGEQGG